MAIHNCLTSSYLGVYLGLVVFMTNLELKIPDDVLENIPSGRDAMVQYLAKYFDGVIAKYEVSFQKRVTGALGGPLSRYEKSTLKDFLLDLTIGNIDEASQPRIAVEF